MNEPAINLSLKLVLDVAKAEGHHTVVDSENTIIVYVEGKWADYPISMFHNQSMSEIRYSGIYPFTYGRRMLPKLYKFLNMVNKQAGLQGRFACLEDIGTLVFVGEIPATHFSDNGFEFEEEDITITLKRVGIVLDMHYYAFMMIGMLGMKVKVAFANIALTFFGTD